MIQNKGKFIFLIFCFNFFLSSLIFSFVYAENNNYYIHSGVPKILPRETWEDSYNLKDLLKIEIPHNYSINSPLTPDYFPVSRIIIHSSDCQVFLPDGSRNPNCNSSQQDTISLIKNIYRYHVLTKNYPDIGYHFVIGWNGEIFEGKYGGSMSVGNHTDIQAACQNSNVGSVGILLLGNLSNEAPSSKMLNSLERLLGWLSYAYSLNPNNMQIKKDLWVHDNFLENSECDLEKGSFEDSWMGPVVSFHGDNKNIHSFNLNNVRQKAIFWKEQYSDFLYRFPLSNNIWSLKNGKGITRSRVGSRVEEINKNQLLYFVNDRQINISNNDLVQLYFRSNIYLVQNKKLHQVTSENIFNNWNFNASSIKYCTLKDLIGLKIGESLNYLPGTLIKAAGHNEVYIVNKDGQLSHITALELFNQKGFNWKDVKTISYKELQKLPKTQPLLFPTGSLLKGQGDVVYLVQGKCLKPIKSARIFESYGFNWEDIITLSSGELAYYDNGDFLKYSNNSILEDTLNNISYLILNGRKNILSNNLKNDLLKNNNVFQVLPGELKNYLLGVTLKNQNDIDFFNKAFQNSKFDVMNQLENLYNKFNVININLGIFYPETNLIIQANNSYNVLQNNQEHKLDAGQSFNIDFLMLNDNIQLKAEDISTYFTIYEGKKDNLNKIGSFYGEIVIQKGYVKNSPVYWIINKVFIEDYLRGIKVDVQPYDNQNYLKALAIAHRSYLMHFYVDQGGRYQDKPFDINRKEDNIFYEGITQDNSLEYINAVEDTEGEILTYKKDPVRAFYSKDTCGISADARKVFGSFYQSFPYLWGGVQDPQGTNHSNDCPALLDNAVGMSLAGARTLAQKGKNYYEILTYYYPNVKLNKVY
jgi:hypothetical protein